MPVVIAMDSIKSQREEERGGKPPLTRTTFFRSSKTDPVTPSAYAIRYDPRYWSDAHYHEVDEFQVTIDGRGKFGRHEVTPYCVHFARAYTPYGPLESGEHEDLAFITLRTRYDPGAQFLTDSLDRLKKTPDRKPWQIAKKAEFPPMGTGVTSKEIPGFRDAQGLFADALTMAPNARTTAPDPSGGDGQYILVVKGGMTHGERKFKALTLVFLEPDEPAFTIVAGAQGLEALVLNFPRVEVGRAAHKVEAARPGFRKWQCVLCSFAYDEALGMPDEGIPQGTRWQDVPETWNCPDCSAAKGDFQMVVV